MQYYIDIFFYLLKKYYSLLLHFNFIQNKYIKDNKDRINRSQLLQEQNSLTLNINTRDANQQTAPKYYLKFNKNIN